MINEKNTIAMLFGAAVAALFGGWDGAMLTLAIFMLADYVSGIALAGVFKRSKKSASGALESRAGLKGLFRKAGMLIVVIIAVRLDMLTGMNGVLRTGVIFALVANEAISLIENLGAMGVPLPKVLTKAIEQLREKTEGSAEHDNTDK